MKQTKADLIANITRDLADNATQDISPRDVRQNMLDVVDSIANLLFTEEIVSTNFSTPATRTTIAGEDVLSKLGQEGYVSTDNTAIGYSALKQNYQGVRNTAVGAYTLTCNIYGTDNVAIGYSALAGNSNGVGNVGIGEYSLYYNKLGNLNVAIGHGAGYYADREDSNKLYIGVHPVTEQYVCDNPEGVGLTPLVYGDFELGRFGVNVNEFHPYGSVQVSGAIAPSQDEVFDLGHEDYSFNEAHVRSVVFYEGNSHTYDASSDTVVVSGVHMHGDDVKPLVDNVYSLGSPSNRWRDIKTVNLTVDGVANINQYNAISSCEYECKTLYLATSGICDGSPTPCGYLDKDDLNGAGFVVPSSGDEGVIDYSLVLISSGNPPYSYTPDHQSGVQSAYWTTTSNINVSGLYSRIFSNKHLGSGDTAFGRVNNGSAFFTGMNCVSSEDASQGRIIFTTNDQFDDTNDEYRKLEDAGDGEGTMQSRYLFSINDPPSASHEDQTESRRLTLRTRFGDVPASINIAHGDGYTGSELYCPNSGTIAGLFISTYETGNTNDVNTVSIMQADATGGVLGVSNFEGLRETKLPETILNVRSTSDAALRVTAENAGDVHASLELCGELNCLQDAAAFEYNKPSGIATISTYLDSGRKIHTTYDSTDGNTIFNNGNVQLGEGSNSGVLSFRDHPSDSTVSTQDGFTRLFSRHVDNKLDQASELVYVDTSGNVLPISLVTADSDPVTWDSQYNLFGGSGTPSDKGAISSASGNTTFGNYALHDLTISGDPQGYLNTTVGFSAGSGIYDGKGNILLGSESFNYVTSGVSDNIVIGNKVNMTDSTSGNILIGSDTNIYSNNNLIIGNKVLSEAQASGLPNNSFMIGNTGDVLVSGSIPNHYMSMPSGTLKIESSDNVTSMDIKSNRIVVRGSGDRYGLDQFVINFTGSGGLSNDILTLDHSSHYTMSNDESYDSVNPRRPYVHVDGDARIRGALRFSDGTSMESASGVNNIQSLLDAMQEQINVQTIEGFMAEDVDAPSSWITPTVGLITKRDGTSETIVLRDQYLRLEEGDYVIANRIMIPDGSFEYRPVWVSNEYNTCGCARPSTLDGGNI